MKKEILSVLIFFLLFIISASSLFSADFLAAPEKRGDFWISAGAETAFYSASGLSYGACLSAAYGEKISIGIKGIYFLDKESEVDVLEINLFLSWFLLNRPFISGPFFQFTAGPAFFLNRNTIISPEGSPGIGMVTAGLAFGWRFLFAKRFFIEPSIRAGYPFLAGISLSGGVRF